MNSTEDKHKSASNPAEPGPKVSGWGKGRARAYWLAMFLFTGLFSCLLAVMTPDFRGRPIYPNMDAIPGASTEEVKEFFDGVPFVLEFEATQPNYNEIYWLNLLSAKGEEIGVKVENLTKGRTVAETVTATGENTTFEPDNEVGDLMRVTMKWLRPPPPHLLLAKTPPTEEVTLSGPDGEKIPAAPYFYLGRKADPKSDWDRSLLLFPEEDFARASEIGVSEGETTKKEATAGDFERFEFGGREPVTIRFVAPEDDLSFLKIPGMVKDPRTRVKIIVRNETTGELIKNSMAEDGVDYERRFTGNNKKGDKIAIDLIWRLPLKPTVQRVTFPAEPPIVTKIGDREVDFPLAMLMMSPWPTWQLHWLWVPVLGAFLVVWFRKRWAFGYLVLLGLACTATSILSWQQNYAHSYPHVDPDGYGQYGEQIAHYLNGEGDRGKLSGHMHQYSHTHVALTPALIAIGVVCGLPTTISYLVVVNLASFGNLLLLWRLATRKLGMEMRAALMLVSLYATHIFVLKSFGRASTDAIGELLVVTMLYLLADRLNRVTTRQTILISVMILLQVLARPPGIVIGPFMLGMTLLCDVWRERKLDLVKRIFTGLWLGLGPLLFLVACYASFDWIHNQELAFAKSKQFRPFSTPLLFWYCMPALLQIFPLFWIGLRWKEWRRHLPMLAVWGIWGVFFTVLLIGVKAPFLLRLFLPVVPAVVLLAAPGVAWLEAKHRMVALVICLLWCGTNVGVQIYNSSIEYVPPVLFFGNKRLEIGRFIY
jgi:hypothetical protein